MTTQTEIAILAGGCFWGMEGLLRRHPGVLSTRVGYTGGDVPNATYERLRLEELGGGVILTTRRPWRAS